MNRKKFILIMAALGILVGVSMSYVLQSDSSECKNLQKDIRENQNFTGTISCYPPGVIDVNVSDKVEESSELKCVCQNVNNGNVQTFPVFETN